MDYYYYYVDVYPIDVVHLVYEEMIVLSHLSQTNGNTDLQLGRLTLRLRGKLLSSGQPL